MPGLPGGLFFGKIGLFLPILKVSGQKKFLPAKNKKAENRPILEGPADKMPIFKKCQLVSGKWTFFASKMPKNGRFLRLLAKKNWAKKILDF